MARHDTQFKVGNPGRPRGSKGKVTKEYLDRLWEDFKEHGEIVLARVRKDRPDVYLKLIAQLVPKDLDISHSGDVHVQIVSFLDTKPEDLKA